MDRRRAAQLLNGISLARVVLTVPVMALVLLGPAARYCYVAAAVLFTAAAATDFLDGYLARRWRRTSELGVFLDTTADKLLVSGALIALVAVGRASPWAALVIIGREIAVIGLKSAAATSGTVVYPSIWGKLKFNVQFVAILLAMLRYHHRIGPMYLDEWAMTVAAAVTVASAWSYFARLSSLFKGTPR
ncbi:MAG TPA: CDP-diacylglycerol--glycerol-3-phosphate 3-phosphatidyltransferase [Streptosporangiaceae bacterium]|jgi:CDP-diacylglycerol--glycerol-3-phosphate 3-phosphatidyltransferase|nr:CDP-diacylglycerol--glycerol-3-phosphate 3-phosphatidyltransferase [Streptosporangiaceae bacterium]